MTDILGINPGFFLTFAILVSTSHRQMAYIDRYSFNKITFFYIRRYKLCLFLVKI